MQQDLAKMVSYIQQQQDYLCLVKNTILLESSQSIFWITERCLTLRFVGQTVCSLAPVIGAVMYLISSLE